jgi:hypothetical protein
MIKGLIKKLFSKNIIFSLSLFRERVLYWFQILINPFRQKKALKKVKKKDKIIVAFILILIDNFKYDEVISEFKRNGKYYPIIIICPIINKGNEFMEQQYELCKKYCEDNHYEYFETWDNTRNSWIDFKNELKPDIIFFTNPHNLTYRKYLITNFSDRLTCYVPYSIRTDHLIEMGFNSPFQQLTWINFYETEIHKSIAQKTARNKGKNVIIVGYPTIDAIFEKKKQARKRIKKRIIWAPHWTILQSELLNRACFLDYYDYFIELGNKYQDEIEIVLRPCS